MLPAPPDPLAPAPRSGPSVRPLGQAARSGPSVRPLGNDGTAGEAFIYFYEPGSSSIYGQCNNGVAGNTALPPLGYVGGMNAKAAPSGEGQVVPARDVVVLRALAHPARLSLLEHLAGSGPATATECAGVVGLSPSAVSYHLRALARAGLVEAAPGRGDGRERLWRPMAERYQVEGGASLGPEARKARQELLESLLAWDETRVRRYLARIDDEPRQWQDAAFYTSTTLLVTVEELTALGRAVDELLTPYRRGSRADAPAGAREVSAVVRALPS